MELWKKCLKGVLLTSLSNTQFKRGGWCPLLHWKQLNTFICMFKFRMVTLVSNFLPGSTGLMCSSQPSEHLLSYNSSSCPQEVSKVSGGQFPFPIQGSAFQSISSTESIYQMPGSSGTTSAKADLPKDKLGIVVDVVVQLPVQPLASVRSMCLTSRTHDLLFIHN